MDIVIPARGEVKMIASTLAAILSDGGQLNLCVIVALNGEKHKETYDAAFPFVALFKINGHELKFVKAEEANKASALNSADQIRLGEVVVYCDADAVIWPGTLTAIAKALNSKEPRLVGPQRKIIRPSGLFARCYCDIWETLPNVKIFVGGGCYAVNRAGRKLWGEFPNIVADDAYVFSRFQPKQRFLLDEAAIYFVMPDGLSLLRAIRRWREGNQIIRTSENLAKKSPVTLKWIVTHKSVIHKIPAFLLVNFASYLIDSPVQNQGWVPERVNSQ